MSVIFIQKRKGAHYLLPSGAEIMWFGIESALPAEWSIETAISGKFVMAANTGGATDTPAGSNSHKHEYSSNTGSVADHTHTARGQAMGGSSGSITHFPTANERVATNGHTHAVGSTQTSGAGGGHYHPVLDTEYETVLPPYRRLYWIKSSEEAACPVNGIIIWNGNAGDRPDNFEICNGSNSTPDMRDNFVYAASADGEVDDSGGAETHTHGNQTVSEAGEHTHSISVSVGDSGYNERASDYGGTSALADQHSHSGSGNFDTDPDHDHTLGDTESGSSLPQYIYLYYVMRAE